MGVGKVGAINSAKGGGVLAVVIMSSYRITDYVLRDNATLSQLIGGLAMDVAKIATSTAVSVAFASAAAGATAFALGPLAVAILVGFGVSYVLDVLDNKYQLTEKVIAVVEEMQNNLQRSIQQEIGEAAQGFGGRVVDSVIDATIEHGKSTLSNWIRSYKPQLPRL